MNDSKRKLLKAFLHMKYLEIDSTERKPGDNADYIALQELVSSGHVKRVDLDHIEFYRATSKAREALQ